MKASSGPEMSIAMILEILSIDSLARTPICSSGMLAALATFSACIVALTANELFGILSFNGYVRHSSQEQSPSLGSRPQEGVAAIRGHMENTFWQEEQFLQFRH
jgi:hypothetical protein